MVRVNHCHRGSQLGNCLSCSTNALVHLSDAYVLKWKLQPASWVEQGSCHESCLKAGNTAGTSWCTHMAVT